MKVKICGITNQEIAELCEQNNCDFVGAVFYDKSCRFIEIKDAKQVFKNLKKTKKVAVLVNSSQDAIKKIIDQFNPDLIQFHGQESIEEIELFKKNHSSIPIIKALTIADGIDQKIINSYQKIVDYFLFDGAKPGSGNIFDWQIFNQISIQKPWFLAGGITLANIDQAITITKANLIDISSGLEKSRGIKDKKLVINFLNHINYLRNKTIIEK